MKYSVNQLFKIAIKDIQSLGYPKKQYSENTPIKLGFSQSDFTKVSYITEKRQNDLIWNHVIDTKVFTKENRKKYFYHTTIEKLINKFFNDVVSDCYKSQQIIEQLKKYLFDLKKLDLKVYEGSEIATIYSSESHKLGTMSCMQGKPIKYFEIYKDLPVKMYAIIEGGILYARCLVWEVKRSYWDKPKIYIDRIYTYAHNEPLSNHIYKRMIQAIMKANKIDKSETTYAFNFRHINSDDLNGRSYSPFNQVYLKTMCLDDFEHFPYMDTFQYGSNSDDCLSFSKDSDSSHFLDSTSGGFSEVEQITCECCGYDMHEDEEIYCEDVQETRCQDCAVHSDADGVWYAVENCTYIGGNVNSWVQNTDIEN